LLVAPILKADLTRRLVYLPPGNWYDYWTNRKYSGGTMIGVEAPLDTVPLFVRAGAILPAGPPRNYVGEKPVDPITFTVYPDEKGTASARLYEDDGVSPAYKRGVFRRTRVTVRRGAGGLVISVAAPEGTFNPGPRQFKFVVQSAPYSGKTVIVADDGRARQAYVK